MNHWIIAPIILPAFVAPLLVLAMRRDIKLQRVFSFASTFALFAIALTLLHQAASGAPQLYLLGNWPAPFGIVLVLDRLSALMVLLTASLAIPVLLYASSGWDRRGAHFHALFQFQLMGLNGAFLTGDLFNLFVFFEVLLIASYGLMLHGAGAARLRAGFQYVAVNLTASTLFLVSVGIIYGVTGTLNMADLAVRVPTVAAGDQALLKLGAVLLLVVFCIKAALVPLHFWLPATYAAASAPVAALFAIMTKVGAYAILRVYTLAFGEGAGELAGLAAPWLAPAALVTVTLGMIGVLAARSLRWMACFAAIGSMGMLLTAIGPMTEQSIAASLYYLLHSTLATAALFLVVDLIAERRGTAGDTISPAPTFAQAGLLGILFMLVAMAMAGLPPLSGYIGKLLILDATRGAGAAWVWSVILASSLIAMVGFARAGSTVLWKSGAIGAGGTPDGASHTPPSLYHHPAPPLVAVAALVAGLALLTAFAGPVTEFLGATARQLVDPHDYIAAVLGDAARPPR